MAKNKIKEIKETKDKKVEVNEKALEKLLKTVEEGEKERQQLKTDIEMLKTIADKSRLSWYEEGKKTIGPAVYKLSTFDGKVIVGWRTVKDVVEKHPLTGVRMEDQQYEIILEDGTKQLIKGYNKFADTQYGNQIRAQEIEKTIKEGKVTLKLKAENGREYLIDSVFVN